jgi:polyisoprenoid-binding protein YceI
MRLPSPACVLLVLLLSVGAAHAAAGTWSIDTSRSALVVRVFRAGALSPKLHDHAFMPEHWGGHIRFDPEAPAACAVDVTVDATSLRDHQPELSAEDQAKVEDQVRSPRILDTARYPGVRFRADRLEDIETLGPQRLKGVLVGTLELHGQSRPLRIPIEAAWSARGLEAVGAVSFRQSDFGIKPYKKLLGTIAVRDEVRVELKLQAHPAER